jgi:hypothetical protein
MRAVPQRGWRFAQVAPPHPVGQQMDIELLARIGV